MPTNTSRREFIKAASTMVVSAQVSVRPRVIFRPAGAAALAYVGTYSSPRSGQGQGIHIFGVNPATGALSPKEVFPDNTNPTWLAFDRDKTHLYAANETGDFEGTPSGSVSAFSVDSSSGRLALLNRVSSRGAGPTHLSVHPAGRHVLVANYGGGSEAVLPILSNGELGPATDVKENRGAVGPKKASSAPPGSHAVSGHDRPHAHMIESDPAGRFVLATDLGLDQLLVWKFDVAKGTLTPNDPPAVQLPPGDGPRHFAFHPNGRWLYSLQEEGSTLALFDYSAADGRLAARQTVSTLPRDFAGTNFTSGVRVSADGRFVYAANRLHDSIAIFAVGSDGTVSMVDEEWTRGDYPRSFTIDPSGQYLYSCNQRSDAITIFRVSRETGRLEFTGQYVPVGAPSLIVFG
jgi:6-phosphogluconolactonase (cycloisomerase 2 family)